MFREAYERRRCIVPIDGFFEWKAIKGKAKQPYAIAMKDGSPFGVAGLCENWKSPAGEWLRTFAIITTDSNELVGQIHASLRRCEYGRSQRGSTSLRTMTPQFLTRFQPRRWKVSEQANQTPKGRDAHDQLRPDPIVQLDRRTSNAVL
jgi:hypothetical protein